AEMFPESPVLGTFEVASKANKMTFWEATFLNMHASNVLLVEVRSEYPASRRRVELHHLEAGRRRARAVDRRRDRRAVGQRQRIERGRGRRAGGGKPAPNYEGVRGADRRDSGRVACRGGNSDRVTLHAAVQHAAGELQDRVVDRARGHGSAGA